MTLVAVSTTVATREDALRIGREMIDRRLAACAEIEAIESIYAWSGAVHHEREFRVLLKTTLSRADAVEAALRALHPYELPAIHASTLERVHPPYAQWVEQAVSGA